MTLTEKPLLPFQRQGLLLKTEGVRFLPVWAQRTEHPAKKDYFKAKNPVDLTLLDFRPACLFLLTSPFWNGLSILCLSHH